uniref:Chromosome 7 open reading frame 57 n=1 Tax=Athene cunicularia TaxID=194338 RepID=A0A663MWP7_ATHCN
MFLCPWYRGEQVLWVVQLTFTISIFFSSIAKRSYHMPLKQQEKSLKSPLPPTSQIVGLGDLAKDPHEVLSGCCRKRIKEKWIKETDSAYYRLAKQGDLWKHYTPVTMKSSPAAYVAPDSYVSSLPDYMIHRELKADDHHGNSYKTRRGPFDFDVESVWQWDIEDKENAEKKKVGWRGMICVSHKCCRYSLRTRNGFPPHYMVLILKCD